MLVERSYLFAILRDKGHLCTSEKDSEREKVLMLGKGDS